jgi:thiol-disulfide isomerase/thioredoxin
MSRSNASRHKKRAEQRASAKAKAHRSKLIKAWAGVGAVAVAIVALTIFTWPEPDIGSTTAESWDLPALRGDERIALSDFEGKPTVVAFFASWCEVCEEEIPGFVTLSHDIGHDINFVGVNSQDNGGGGGDADKWGMTGAWPIARDIGGRNQSGLSVNTFGARGMPLTVIYDESGSVVHVQRGGLSAAGLLNLLEDLVGYTA